MLALSDVVQTRRQKKCDPIRFKRKSIYLTNVAYGERIQYFILSVQHLITFTCQLPCDGLLLGQKELSMQQDCVSEVIASLSNKSVDDNCFLKN